MFAVIETGGKQYLVQEGSVIKVEKLEVEQGTEVKFDNIVYASNTNAVVKAEVLKQCRGEKVIIFKKKRRKNYRRKAGHRQYITVLRIISIKK
ncbi:50S ribosomal protein L21 [Wolbachia endosymbiont of Ctenocephalides felis wCfeT]|uniref:50S ribosomal protein L21 n=1 Tax=Wolbachia endosymbiont of Ctenocephalides felis wCfeT TaxID=2732593 RepID=UPI0014467C3B|nr:50S ribosomal protein L21 [Wolbachia endosymbiont of Ctenocephalides felis wCfeT]